MNLRSSTVVDPSEFRSRVLLEMAKAAGFVEEDLGLANKPSRGISISKESLELPLIEDHPGPGYGVVLVADPEKCVRERSATSLNERAIHYWITEDEATLLGSVISGLQDQNEIPSDSGREHWPLLRRIAATQYESEMIKPFEITELEREVNYLRKDPTSKDLGAALERILSVCRSAHNYSLGIYTPATR